MLIKAYNPEWKNSFHKIANALREVLPENGSYIEHVGSTSVEGLAAKPIIDIDVVYTLQVSFEEIKHSLSKLGYFHNGDQGIPTREAFKRERAIPEHPVLDRISHHLYVCREDSPELARHLAFRNQLRRSEKTRLEYEEIKRALADETGQDRERYAELKEDRARAFILNAIEEYRSNA